MISGFLKSYLPYEFTAAGIVWAVVTFYLGLAIILWPTITCIGAGVLLKSFPSGRLTWSWTISSAVLGLLLCSYQAYAAIPFAVGAFSDVALETLGAFIIFAIVHIMLLYGSYTVIGRKPATT